MTHLLLALLLTALPFSGRCTVTEVRGMTLHVKDSNGKTYAHALPGIEPASGRRLDFEGALARIKGRHITVRSDGRVFLGDQDIALDLIKRGLARESPWGAPLPREVRERYKAASPRR